jgi:hypothetical protein
MINAVTIDVTPYRVTEIYIRFRITHQFHLRNSRISHVREVGNIKVHMVRTWLCDPANKE